MTEVPEKFPKSLNETEDAAPEYLEATVMPQNETGSESNDHIPPEIKAKLVQTYGLAPDIPESVNESIRENARRHLSSMPAPDRSFPTVVTVRNRLRWVSLTVGSMAATALVLVLLIRQPPNDQPGPGELAQRELTDAAMPPAQQSTSPAVLLTDLNEDGAVDILDAFTLASRLEAGGTLAGGDVNRDGRQDQEDVQWIASSVVLLHDPF